MIGATVAGLALALTACAPMCAPPGPSHLAPCTGDVVTVWRDDPVGCDVIPPQRLDVLDVSRIDCDDMGGRFVELTSHTGTCHGVDY